MKKLSAVIMIFMFIFSNMALAKVNFEIGDRVKCGVEILNVRYSASPTSEIVDKMSINTEAIIISGPIYNEGYDWYNIKYANIEGWVAGKYLEFMGKAKVKTAFVEVDSLLMLRENASVQSKIITKLKSGVKLDVLGEAIHSGSYSWVKVKVDGNIGYVAQKYLSFEEDSSNKSETNDKITKGESLSSEIELKRDENYLPTIAIKTSKPVIYEEYVLDGNEFQKPRIVIDIKNFKLENEIDKELGIYPIETITSITRGSDTRIIMSLKEKKKHYTNDLEGSFGIKLHFEKDDYYIGDTRNPVEKGGRDKKNDSDLNEFLGAESKDGDDYSLKFNTQKMPEYKIIKLNNPNRYVIDFLNTELLDEDLDIDYMNPYLVRIRTSQFEPDSNYEGVGKIVRVVFDLKSDVFIESKIENGYLITNFAKEKESSSLKGLLNYKEFGEEAQIIVQKNDLDDENIEFESEHNRLKFKLKEVLEDSQISINDGKVAKIRYEDNDIAYVDLYNNISYSIDEKDESYRIKLTKINHSGKGKSVIIDAGHGGDHRKVYNGHIGDSGAISPYSQIKEKDLTLNVSNKLKELLKNRGYNIIMTRETDEYIYPYDRAEIANKTDGEIFLSIHFNSSEVPTANGILTMYCPSYESELKNEDQYPLAKVMQETLVEKLNMKNIGIWKKPAYIVIRETKMPAVILELGFLTNRQEEKKIITDGYHQKAAEAIADAVDRYFNQ